MKITKRKLRKLIREQIENLSERGFPGDDGWTTGVDGRNRRSSQLPNDPDWRAGYEDGGAGDPPADEDNDQYMNGFAAGRRGMLEMKITENQLRTEIRKTLLKEVRPPVPGTLGEWIPVRRTIYSGGEYVGVTEWVLPTRDKYGESLIIATIRFTAPGMSGKKSGWRYRVYSKNWKGFNAEKQFDKLANERYPLDGGPFRATEDLNFGETLKDEAEAKVVEFGGVLKTAFNPETETAPNEALIKATADMYGVEVEEGSEGTVTVRYETEDSGSRSRADLQRALSANGFSGFNKGRYMGGGMAGFRGGPQQAVSAQHQGGGRIFADFSTSTSYGEKTTYVTVRTEKRMG